MRFWASIPPSLFKLSCVCPQICMFYSFVFVHQPLSCSRRLTVKGCEVSGKFPRHLYAPRRGIRCQGNSFPFRGGVCFQENVLFLSQVFTTNVSSLSCTLPPSPVPRSTHPSICLARRAAPPRPPPVWPAVPSHL